jgi:enamine deaminase RidA (YjgF/YER057c/UK114 family)
MLVLVMRVPLCLPDGRGVGDDTPDYAGKFCGGSRVRNWRKTVSKKRIQPKGLFQRKLKDHVLYSHVVVASGRSLVFIAGQLSRDTDGNIVGPRDMRAQIRQVGENLRVALAEAGASAEDLVKTTTYVTDIDEFFKHPDVRAEIFGQSLPTSTTVEVRRLSHPDLLVEIEAIAMID